MKRKRRAALLALTTALLLSASGCVQAEPELVNEQNFPLEGVTGLTISYDEECVTMMEGEEACLVLREYMTDHRGRYDARIRQGGGEISIREGGRPLGGGGFRRRVELVLPASYGGDLTLTTTSGDLTLEGAWTALRTLRVDSTSGTVTVPEAAAGDIRLATTSGVLRLGDLRAERLEVETTSGTVTCGAWSGIVTYTTTNGDLRVDSASGSGSYRAEHGGLLEVVYTGLTGDLDFYNKSGDIALTLPADASFRLEAATREGEIEMPFSDAPAGDGTAVRGMVGEYPTAAVTLETRSGAIRVELPE